MFDEIDSLNPEIINVQVLDGYLKDGNIRFDSFFMRDDYKYQMSKFQNILKSYESNKRGFVIDDEEDDGYIEDDYTLDDVLEVLVADLDIYAYLYNIPEVLIDNDEWELLFEAIGSYYIERELDGFFMSDMVALNKYAMARSLVYEEDSISLETYIKSLKYLESNIISINNIVEIAERIREVLSIDAVEILANEDGSYGVKNKDASLFLVDDINDSELLKEHLKNNGYNIVDTVGIVENESNRQESDVISFDKIKAKKRNRKNKLF